MPRILINEYGQRVKEFSWEEYQERLRRREPLRRETNLSGRRLVIKHTWGIGDILYSTAAVHEIKKKFPTCKIHYICTCPEILENNPDIEKVYHYMEYSSMEEIGDTFKEDWCWLDYDVPLKGGYNYKIHLRTKPHLNEFLVSLLAKDPKSLTTDELDFVNQASTSVISRYRMIALDMYCMHAFIDPPPEKNTIYYYPFEHEMETARKFLKPLKDKGRKVITLLPYASTPYKNYPHWKEVIRLCPKNYLWLILDSNRREPWRGANVEDCSGVFRIRHSAAVIIEADLHCSSDTGLLYPRAARGKPCVVTYGPHEPQPFLWHFPSAHGLRVESVKGLLPDGKECCTSACFIDTCQCKSINGSKFSPCLEQLSPRVVASKIMEILS
jgi:ADP-heptose:LPS heptosyltransferase